MPRMTSNTKRYFPYVALALLSVALCLCFKSSPLLEDNLPTRDSAIFYYIGKVIAGGGTLYVDVADHKGPVVFFINALAVLLTPNSYNGLWLLGLLFTFAYFVGQYRLFTLFGVDVLLSLFFVSGLGIVLGFLVYYENQVEYWALPFFIWSLYIFCRYYIKDQNIRSLPFMVTGTFCALTFLLRVNMVALWLSFAIVAIIYLLTQKNYNDLFKLMTWFSLGLVLGILPFLLYHIMTNSLSEAFYWNWTVNLQYVSTSDSYVPVEIVRILKNYHLLPIIGLYLLYLFLTFRKFSQQEKGLHLSLVLWLCLESLVLVLAKRTFLHYFLPFLPIATVFLAILLKRLTIYLHSFKKFLFFERLYVGGLSCVLVVLLLQAGQRLSLRGSSALEYNREVRQMSHIIQENSQPEATILSPAAAFYLVSNRKPFGNRIGGASLPEYWEESLAAPDEEKPVFVIFRVDNNARNRKGGRFVQAGYEEIYRGQYRTLFQRK